MNEPSKPRRHWYQYSLRTLLLVKAVMYYLDGPQCYSVVMEEPTDEGKPPFYVDWPYFDWNTTGNGQHAPY